MRRLEMRRGVGFAIGAAIAGAWLIAGEAGPPGGGPPPEKPPEKKPELRSEVFIYEPRNRRDPFVFTRESVFVIEDRRPITPVEIGGKRGPAIPGKSEMTKEQIDAIVAKAKLSLDDAEAQMMAGGFVAAVKACDEGLREIEKGKEEGETPEVRDRLMRVRKAADRLRLRREAEVDFTGKEIRVTGIVSRDQKPQVLINNQILTKGSVVPSTEAQIEEIRPGQIICRYRGFKVRLQQ